MPYLPSSTFKAAEAELFIFPESVMLFRKHITCGSFLANGRRALPCQLYITYDMADSRLAAISFFEQ